MIMDALIRYSCVFRLSVFLRSGSAPKPEVERWREQASTHRPRMEAGVMRPKSMARQCCRPWCETGRSNARQEPARRHLQAQDRRRQERHRLVNRAEHGRLATHGLAKEKAR